ncbi:MAG: AraC family transcriptional regulator [Rectinemataceae bacterium]|nr:AraC family transcriptional regulator [Rectinemataceae bacterium]
MERRNFSSYLTWSDEDERRLVVCTDVGMAEVPPGSPYPPSTVGHPSAYSSVATGRVVNEYQLVYVTKGRGSFTSGDRTWAVLPGSVLAVFPGVRHSYCPDQETGWEEYWVGFKGPSADELRDSGFHSPANPFFPVGVHESMLAVFSGIFSVVESQEPYYQFRAGALVMVLLAEVLGRARKAEQHSESEALVERAKFLMTENIDGTMNVDEVGERLGVARTRFCESFKAYTGMTPYQYFIQLKINRAKEILSAGNAPVKEVAYSLGFDDQYYFSRLFKKKTGVAPSEWAGS